MIEQSGMVRAVHEGVAEVDVERASSCGSCHANQACGTATIARFFPDRSNRIQAINTAQARVGDTVIIGLDDSALRNASFVVYLWPLAGLIGGAILGEWGARWDGLPGGELAAIMGGLLGIAGGLYWVGQYGRQRRHDRRFHPQIVRVLPSPVVKLTPRSPADQ